MSPLSWPVLIGTLALGSPALYAAQVAGTLSPDVAVVRLLVCFGAVWLGCALVSTLTRGAIEANQRQEAAEAAEAQAAADAAAAAELLSSTPLDAEAGGVIEAA